MDFTITLIDKTQLHFKNLRGIRILDGVFNIIPSGHKKQAQVLAANVDVIHAHVQPVKKVYSVIQAQAPTEDTKVVAD